MKKEVINWEEEYNTLPDSELKKIFKGYEKKQKRLAGIPVWILLPVLVIYGFMGYLKGFAATHAGYLMDFSILGVVDFVCFAGCGGLMASSNTKNFVAVPIIMLLEIIIRSGFTDSGNVMQFVMLIYLTASCAYLSKTVNKMNYLRSHPHFPFDERQQEVQFEAMTRSQMLNYLEREQNGGVKDLGYEKIFEEDNPEKFVNPEPELSDDEKMQKFGGNTKANARNKAYLEKIADRHKDDTADNGYFQTKVEYNNFTDEEIARIKNKYSDKK